MRKSRVFFCFKIFIILNLIAPQSLWAKDISYNSEGRRDPFMALTGAELPTGGISIGGIRLEGIIYDPQKQSMAIIGGKTYKVGETIGEATIKEIQKGQVAITVNGEEKILKLRDDSKPR